MTHDYSITFIVPALNESERVRDTVAEILPAVSTATGYEVLCINDGSTDNTAAIMQELSEQIPQVKVLTHDTTMGLGAAYKTGIQNATMNRVIMIPGDNQFSSESIHTLLAAIDDADIIIPFHTNAGEVRSMTRRLISDTYTLIANFLSGQKIPYYNGIVVHKTEKINSITIETDGFAYQLEALVSLLQQGCTFKTVGIELQERNSGETKAFRPRNIIQVAEVFLRMLARKLGA